MESTNLANSFVTPIRLIGLKEKAWYPSSVQFLGGIYDESNRPFLPSLLRRYVTRQIQAHDSSYNVDRSNALVVSGPALYGGILFDHYGHFLLETLSRAWRIAGCAADVYFHKINAEQATFHNLLPWQQELLAALTGDVGRVQFIGQDTVFEELIVPEPGFVSREFCHPLQAQALLKVGGKVGQKEAKKLPHAIEKVWLSRAFWQKGRITGEIELEQALEKQGFFICHPERYSVAEQIHLFEHAHYLAGFTGSAFHTVLLARNNGCQLLHFFRFSPENENYSMCVNATGFNARYYNYFESFNDAADHAFQHPAVANVQQNRPSVWATLYGHRLVAEAVFCG